MHVYAKLRRKSAKKACTFAVHPRVAVKATARATCLVPLVHFLCAHAPQQLLFGGDNLRMSSAASNADEDATNAIDENASPIMRTFRALRTLSLPAALDVAFSVKTQDLIALGKREMAEVLDCMYELTRRREQLTLNRVRLTECVQFYNRNLNK